MTKQFIILSLIIIIDRMWWTVA